MIKTPRPKKDRAAHALAILIKMRGIITRADDPDAAEKLLLKCAYDGDADMVESLLDCGIPLNAADKDSGMTALHLAVGRNHIDLVRMLVSRGASFVSDKQGRMPTTIAAECEVSEELCDFIVEAEAAAEARDEGV
jgi:ankyrin repeat protein